MARLTMSDRMKISKMYNAEKSVMEIAVKIGCHPQTIYDELKRGYTGKEDKNGRRAYDPKLAQRVVQSNMRRVGCGKRARA